MCRIFNWDRKEGRFQPETGSWVFQLNERNYSTRCNPYLDLSTSLRSLTLILPDCSINSRQLDTWIRLRFDKTFQMLALYACIFKRMIYEHLEKWLVNIYNYIFRYLPNFSRQCQFFLQLVYRDVQKKRYLTKTERL